MQQLNATFTALSDATRRAIVAQLADDELAISELAEPYSMSLTAVSKHVQVLKKAGLVDMEKRGRTHYCRLRAEPMKQAVDWLNNYQQFWEQQFNSLTQHLQKDKS